MGAWIETKDTGEVGKGDVESHPAWVRGLKPNDGYISVQILESHPAWVRGLKQKLINRDTTVTTSRTPRGCVD